LIETDEKYDKRRRIMQCGIDLMTHVLNDPGCERVVVIGHSLGTSVAHDTLLALTNANRVTNLQDPIFGAVDLRKVRHFVTMGSPIDKINYFFESYRSQHYRYRRVVETLRGDITTAPFTRGTQPYVHWVNFWDEADIISGPVESPVGREHLRHLVDNVHVRNLRFPSPGRAHLAYFWNRRVIGHLVDMICLDRLDFATAPMREDGRGRDRDSCLIGPGEAPGRDRRVHRALVAVPWLGLVTGGLFWFGLTVPSVLVGSFTLAIPVLAVVLAVGRNGMREPI
jgi:pimeloyl-ACP methyl ester carboxylesterase